MTQPWRGYSPWRSPFATAIQRSNGGDGRYRLVGSVPAALTIVDQRGTPQVPPRRVSMSWATEQEAIDALLALGIAKFQRADCSWYAPRMEG